MVEIAVDPEMTHGFGPNLDMKRALTVQRPSAIWKLLAGWTARIASVYAVIQDLFVREPHCRQDS
jgi:hypothetical protein